jgi:S-adenosylmethionine hydrolase
MGINPATLINTLLTDFRTRDYFVGAMKGVIYTINRNAQIIDITHEIAAQNIKSAAFTLDACCQNFPAKTVFVAVVDPGIGSSGKAITIETESCCFVASDNGLLSFVYNEAEKLSCFSINEREIFFAERQPHV